MEQKVMERKMLANDLVSHRWWFFLFGLVTFVSLTYGAQYVYFESDYRIFFSDDNPQMIAHESNQDRFVRSENITFVVAPQNEQVFHQNTLKMITELTEASWQMPFSSRVDSITNYQHTWVEDDDLIVEDLVLDAEALSEAELGQRKNIALSEPALINKLISDRAHVSAVSVNLNLPEEREAADAATLEAVAAAREIVQAFEVVYPEIKMYLVGQTMVNATFNEMSTKDTEELIPFMLLLIIVLLQVILRSVVGTVCSVVLIVFSVVATQGFMGWMGFALNQVNVAAPVIILSIAVCDAVHILNSYLYNLSHMPDRFTAMKASLRTNVQPIFLTSITTAIGFSSMNFSDSPPFQELGTIAAFGVMIAFFFSMTIFPTIVLLFPGKSKSRKLAAKSSEFSVKIGHFAIAHSTKLFYGLLVFALVLISFMFRNDLNDDTVGYFHEDVPFRQAADFTQANLTGLDQISYALDSGVENGVNDPEFLKKVDAFSSWYLDQPEVVQVTTFTDTIKRLNQNMHNDDPEWYRIPDDRELAAQYVLLYEMSLPFGLDLNNQLNNSKSAMLLTVNVQDQKAKQLIALDERAQLWLAANAPELQAPGASVSVMFAHIGQRNIDSMLSGSIAALILVTLTLIISLRSLKFGLMSLLPNAFPAAMAFGLWGIFVAEVNLAVAVIFTITLGIVVDDTVHFLTKYLKARQSGKSPEDSILYAFTLVGKAIITTTIVLASGFMVLAQSSFDVNASMGLMVAITIVIALIWDFLFLPALLLKMDKQTKSSTLT